MTTISDASLNDMTYIFTNIYVNNIWGTNMYNDNYLGHSGIGSTTEYNNEYLVFLEDLIKKNDYKIIVDIGCGDIGYAFDMYNKLDIFYFGYDVYDKMIEHNIQTYSPNYKYHFNTLDCYKNTSQLVLGDLCIIKDVFSHWSNECIENLLTFLTQNYYFKCILICNCSNQVRDNLNIRTGEYREISCDLYPLNKFDCKKVLNYNNKEVSIIMSK
jgi:hypothetical protein